MGEKEREMIWSMALLLSLVLICKGSLETSINDKVTPLCKCTDCAVPCPNISTASRSECAASCSACTAEPYMCDQWAYGEEHGPSCFPSDATVTLQDGSKKEM